ncbi:MAG: class I SAM-dependent methyltransferase [Boseongicola sp.]
MTSPSETKPNPLPSKMQLLADLSRLYKVQPATALWRAVEIWEVLRDGLPDGSGLDLGCGDGALTGVILRYLSNAPEFIGLDYDPDEIQVADRRGVYASTVCSGGEDMPLDDASVDFVFSNSVLEHLPDLDATIGECARILRPGGLFIATVPAPEFRDLLRAKGKTGDAREEYVSRVDARLAHHNYLNGDGWEQLLASHGLTMNSARGYLTKSQVQRWEKLSSMTAGALQALGASNALLYRMQRFTRSDDKSAGGLLQKNPKIAAWSRAWARVVGGQVLPEHDSYQGPFGCLLVRAHKPAG